MKFSPRRRRILLAFAETLLPPDVGIPFTPDQKNMVKPTEKFLESFGKAGFRAIGSLLLLFDLAALIFLPRFKTFTKLSPSDREKYMEGWEKSRIKYRRMMFILLKAFTCMVLLSDREVKAQIGYDLECLVEMKR